MSGLRILILTPTTLPYVSGNAMTVARWSRSLGGVGHTVKTISSLNLDARELSWEIAAFRPDILHIHHALKSGALFLEHFVQEVTRHIPMVVSPAGTDINHDRSRKSISGTLLKVCRLSEKIILQSPWMLKITRALLPGMEDRMVYIPKSFFWQGDESANLQEACWFQPGDFIFFFPAGIRPVKGNLECLGRLEPVYDKRPQIRVVFAGPALDAVYAARFEAEIQRLSVFARWITRISPAAMRSAYETAHVVLNASFSEGLSNALLEAMAAKRPMLASDIPGNRWPVLGNGNERSCGYLFDLRNPDDFIEKAIRLVDDDGLRREFAEA